MKAISSNFPAQLTCWLLAIGAWEITQAIREASPSIGFGLLLFALSIPAYLWANRYEERAAR